MIGKLLVLAGIEFLTGVNVIFKFLAAGPVDVPPLLLLPPQALNTKANHARSKNCLVYLNIINLLFLNYKLSLMIVGVTKISNSALSSWTALFLNKAPNPGISPNTGTLERVVLLTCS